MIIRQIKQAVSRESLFTVLSGWCRDGAGHTTWTIRVLSAFVSGGAVRAMEPLLDVFLADGNSVDIIFGIDRGGTDIAAIRALNALRKAYPGQVAARLFHAPSKASIFHPKLYLLKHDRGTTGIIGSANLTLSGLGSNLESLLLCDRLTRSNAIGRELLSIWDTFARPQNPLKEEFLQPLDDAKVAAIVSKLPKRSREDASRGVRGARDLWAPLSTVPLPRSPIPAAIRRIPRGLSAFLLYDIMGETRFTQMQIPLAVVESFFGVARAEPADVQVSIISEGRLSQPITRPIVISKGAEGTRLMRRLEMPTIKHLSRPLIAVFVKLAGRSSFAYKLFPRDTTSHRTADALLRQFGQQGSADRRYYIGKIGDEVWGALKSMVFGS